MFTGAEQAIYDRLREYVADKDFILNPDKEIVARVVRGLSMREQKNGAQYCPCRMMTKDENENKKIICPCVYHEAEVLRDGQCHCLLFTKKV